MKDTIAHKARHPRIRRERQTIEHMVRIYCSGHHTGSGPPCAECEELLGYALLRLDKCRYRELKPTCANCPTHCYSPQMKKKVMEVMAYSGPRMSWRHPYLAACHMLDGLREAPPPVRAKLT